MSSASSVESRQQALEFLQAGRAGESEPRSMGMGTLEFEGVDFRFLGADDGSERGLE